MTNEELGNIKYAFWIAGYQNGVINHSEVRFDSRFIERMNREYQKWLKANKHLYPDLEATHEFLEVANQEEFEE